MSQQLDVALPRIINGLIPGPLLPSGDGNAPVSSYAQGTEYVKDYFVSYGHEIYRVTQTYTSDTSQSTIDESLAVDVSNGFLIPLGSAGEMQLRTKQVAVENDMSAPYTVTLDAMPSAVLYVYIRTDMLFYLADFTRNGQNIIINEDIPANSSIEIQYFVGESEIVGDYATKEDLIVVDDKIDNEILARQQSDLDLSTSIVAVDNKVDSKANQFSHTLQDSAEQIVDFPSLFAQSGGLVDTSKYIGASFNSNGAMSFTLDDGFTPTPEQSEVLDSGVSATWKSEVDTGLANALPKSGGTMTGGLILNGNAVENLQPVTLQQMNDTISNIETQSLTFEGFISTTEPTLDIREGNLWYQPPTARELPDTDFPWSVKTFTSGAWSDTTTNYTPQTLDLWSNTDDKHGYYYFGDHWSTLDFSGSTFNSVQFEIVDGLVSIKSGAITDTEIADNAGIQRSKIDGLETQLTNAVTSIYKTNSDGTTTEIPKINQSVTLPEFGGGGGSNIPPTNGVAYGTCSTPPGTVLKIVDCPGFVLYTGAIVVVRFNGNDESYASRASTMNVAGTGTYPIVTAKINRLDGYGIVRYVPSNSYDGEHIFAFTGSKWTLLNPADGIPSYLHSLGRYSHTEGIQSAGQGEASHAEGFGCIAALDYAHAEGQLTNSGGIASHAEGYQTYTTGRYSHIEGYSTTNQTYGAHVQGRYNKITTGSNSSWSSIGDGIVRGNGTSATALSNSFRVTNDGKVYGLSAFNSTGADYAEYFEWQDGNPNAEERLGYFVTLYGNKIVKATDQSDYILGIVNDTPAILGNADTDIWQGMWMRDKWGRLLYEEFTDEEGNIGTQLVMNPEYDHTREFISREKRKEWAKVGMLGQLWVYDDGTCQINHKCKPNSDGIATLSYDGFGYRVIEKKEDLVRVIFK